MQSRQAEPQEHSQSRQSRSTGTDQAEPHEHSQSRQAEPQEQTKQNHMSTARADKQNHRNRPSIIFEAEKIYAGFFKQIF
jgi:hypothetical protein